MSPKTCWIVYNRKEGQRPDKSMPDSLFRTQKYNSKKEGKCVMSKDLEKKIDEAVKELSIDDLESVAGGQKRIPDAIITPVTPPAETTGLTPGEIINPKRPAK